MNNTKDIPITLNIYAAKKESGETIVEEVLVEPIGLGQFLLLSAPGLALNLAKNDIFKFENKDTPVQIIERGGNFNIHIYNAKLSLEDYEDFKSELYSSLCGTIDGIRDNNLAITIPSHKGIDIINRFFINFSNITKNEWMFTNVYKNYENFSDDTLLDWWD